MLRHLNNLELAEQFLKKLSLIMISYQVNVYFYKNLYLFECRLFCSEITVSFGAHDFTSPYDQRPSMVSVLKGVMMLMIL